MHFQAVEVHSIQHGRNNALPEETRFACLPGCGLCCSYRVLLSSRDRHRLRSTVGNHAPKFWQQEDGGTALIREAGFCILLDTDQRCSRYVHRPDYCRTYPYKWTTYEQTELDVDLSCPGVGRGETVVLPRPDKHERPAHHQSSISSAIAHVKHFLRAQAQYASPVFLEATGVWAIEELKKLTSSHHTEACTLTARPSTFPRFNAEHEIDLQILKQYVSFEILPSRELFEDRDWIDRHFSKPLWNTRFTDSQNVELYQFWIENHNLHLAFRNGVSLDIQLKDLQDIVWLSDAHATRFAYLTRWLRRQLPIRLANNLAVATSVHTAICYLEFLLEVDWRIMALSSTVAKATGSGVVDRAVVLEAIRGSDGFLRTWCESARLAESEEYGSYRSPVKMSFEE
jgi:Fe-S-cluster containining protein